MERSELEIRLLEHRQSLKDLLSTLKEGKAISLNHFKALRDTYDKVDLYLKDYIKYRNLEKEIKNEKTVSNFGNLSLLK